MSETLPLYNVKIIFVFYFKGGSVESNTWVNICATQDGSEMQLYQDHELTCSRTFEEEFDFEEECVDKCTILLGTNSQLDKPYFTGEMDNLFVYNYVLEEFRNLTYSTLEPSAVNFFILTKIYLIKYLSNDSKVVWKMISVLLCIICCNKCFSA